MEKVIPFEVEFPIEAQILASICKANSKLPKKDRIIVDFDTAQIYTSTIIAQPKPNRNDLCSCGSGKKYKKCCMSLSD